MLLHHGRHRHRVFLILHGNMKDFGCIVIRCYTHHLTEGRRITEDLCLTSWHDQCMTDWDPTNQVRGVSLHRSDRSPLTGQTGLIRDRTKFILQDRFTESRRRKKRYNPLLMQRKLKPMMFCISAISKWLSMMRVQDWWFLINWSILLFNGRSWIMIMRQAVVVRHQSTFNQDGVLRGWLVLKEGSCSVYVLRRRRKKRSRGWGTNNPTTTDQWSLRAKYGGSKQLTSQHDRSNRLRRPVWPVQATGLTGWGCSRTESRIGNSCFGSLRWRNTANILGTRQWGASGSWGYTKRATIWSSTTFKCSGGKILANDNLPHEVSMQHISLQGALKTLIIYLRSWASWKLQHQLIKAELEVFQFELEN